MIAEIKEVNSSTISTSNFTKDQQVAYNGLIEFINSEFDKSDYRRALVGPAGTGKTYLIRAIIKNCNLSYSLIGLSAPTHKACRVLQESISLSGTNVNTLQSDLGLRPNFDIDNFDINNINFDPKGKIKIGNYRLYIIDESSMINKDMIKFINNLCQTSGCKIIYIGDSSQLPPVNEKVSTAFIGVKTFNLKQIVRQGEDNPISDLLEILRDDIKHKTFNFLNYIYNNPVRFNIDNTKGYMVCDNTKFQEIIDINFNNEEFTKNIDLVKVVGYTNVVVNGWNNYIRNVIIKDASKSIITKNDLFISYITLVDVFNDCILKNSEEYIVKEIVDYVHPIYGFKGFMVRFTAIHGGKTTNPIFILDHTDIVSIKLFVNTCNKLIDNAKRATASNKATCWKEYFKFKESCLLLTNIIDKNGKILFNRSLDYGFALTVHKSQGSTFTTTLVDVDNIVYDKRGIIYPNAEEINRRLYVACSRAKDKLYLKFNINKSNG